MAFTYTKRKDGRLMKRVSVNGKIQTLYANDPKDLERQYTEAKYFSNKGIATNDNAITMSLWAKKWLETYKSDKQQATKNMYSDAIRLYINPVLGTMKLKNIRESDIQSLLTKLDDIPRQKEIVLLTIKQILDKAVDNDYIYKNPCNKIKIKKHKPKEKTPLSELEISYLAKVAEEDSRCFMPLLMLYTGLRKEEVAALRYEDIDIENRALKVSKAVHWEKNKPFVKQTKNEETRIIPILDVIFDTISTMKSQHKDTDVVFPAVRNNQIMTEVSIRRVLDHTLHEINCLYRQDQHEALDTPDSVSEIKEIHFSYHQLRHTYVCFLHKAEIPVKEAQYLAGHKTLIVLLNIYTHLDDEDKQNATNKLNNLIKK